MGNAHNCNSNLWFDPFLTFLRLVPKRRDLDLDELAALISERVPERSLARSIEILVTHGGRTRTLGCADAESAMRKLRELSKSDQAIIEKELTKWNLPAPVGRCNGEGQIRWIIISYALFSANPKLSPRFCQSVMTACLAAPTDLAFALSHADAVEALAKNNPDSINGSLVEIAITSCEDTRSHYALRISRWVPVWSDISDAAFHALLSGPPLKSTEAMWLINKRSCPGEALAFAEGKNLPLPGFSQNSPLHTITQAIAAQNRRRGTGGLVCAVRLNGSVVGPDEQKTISRILGRALRRSKPDPQI